MYYYSTSFYVLSLWKPNTELRIVTYGNILTSTFGDDKETKSEHLFKDLTASSMTLQYFNQDGSRRQCRPFYLMQKTLLTINNKKKGTDRRQKSMSNLKQEICAHHIIVCLGGNSLACCKGCSIFFSLSNSSTSFINLSVKSET